MFVLYSRECVYRRYPAAAVWRDGSATAEHISPEPANYYWEPAWAARTRHAAGQDGRQRWRGWPWPPGRWQGERIVHAIMMVNTTRTIRRHRARNRGRFCISQPCTVRFYMVQMCLPKISPRFPVVQYRNVAGKFPLERPLMWDPRLWSDNLFFHFWYYSRADSYFIYWNVFLFFAITPKKTIHFSFCFFLLFSHIPCTLRSSIRLITFILSFWKPALAQFKRTRSTQALLWLRTRFGNNRYTVTINAHF